MARDEPSRREDRRRECAIRQKPPCEEIAEESPARASGYRRCAGFDLRSAELEQMSKIHAGRARSFARAASEARVEMFGQECIDGRASLGDVLHHENAPARRVGLHAEQPIGRTCLFAHAAARTYVELGKRRALGAGCVRCALDDLHQTAPSMRPGSRVPEASNSLLSRRKSAYGA